MPTGVALPKLTINGVSNEQQDWEQGDISSANVNQASTVRLRQKLSSVLTGGKNYTISCASGFEVAAYKGDSLTAFGSSVTFVASGTLGSNTTGRLVLRKMDQSVVTLSDLLNAKVMLNLGTTPAPYELKRGERMVLPSVKGKNLLSSEIGAWEQGTIGTVYTELSSATNRIRSVVVNYQVGKQYTISCASGFEILANPGTSGNTVFGNPVSFIATGSLGRIVLRKPDQSVIVPNEVVNAKPMLNEGTQPTPYEPYAVQLNKKPKRYVPKKNLFDVKSAKWENKSGILVTDGSKSFTEYLAGINTARLNPTFVMPCIPNKQYSISHNRNDIDYAIIGGNINNKVIYDSGWLNSARTFTIPNNVYYFTFIIRFTDNRIMALSDGDNINLQLEEGTTATPYEPYQLVLPRAKSGVAFNGQTDYFQIPSMTMDSVEIECLIDTAGNNGFLLDTRTGYTNGHIYLGAMGGNVKKALVDGVAIGFDTTKIPRYKRTKMLFEFNDIFTDDVTVFSNYTGNSSTLLNGTLYKVTCYLNGNVVAQYNFENPQNIVGDKVIPNAKNLIPSFDDSRWNLHSNFKVLGKDVGRLDATAIHQASKYTLSVLPNTQYLLTGIINGGGNSRMYARQVEPNIYSTLLNTASQLVFTTNASTRTLEFFVSNDASAIGSFDFIKPQLYELSGKEGTIVGKPTPLRKASKRTLYSKR